jgi:sigma-B regulation protein RsbU (phosphoserine phosphatase)
VVSQRDRSGRGVHPIVSVSYLPRVVSALLGALITVSTILDRSTALIVGVVAVGLLWPHACQLASGRANDQKRAGMRVLIADGFVVGVFAGLTAFSPLPAATLVITLIGFELMVGGLRFVVLGGAAMAAGMAATLPVVGFHPRFEPTLLTTNLCLLFLAGAIWSTAHIVNRNTRDLVSTRRELAERNVRIREQSGQLELAVAESIELNEVARAVNATLDLDRVLELVLRSLRKICSFDQVGTLVLDSDEDRLRLDRFLGPRASAELVGSLHGLTVPLAASDSVFVRSLHAGEPVCLRDLDADATAQMAAVDREIHRINPIRSLLICPLEVHEEVVGELFLGCVDEPLDLSEADLLAIERYATHVATAISNARLFGVVERARAAAEGELEIGRRIQREFLPASMPCPDGWQLAARLRPARQVSGDFYDAFELIDGRVVVVVADVCDKGVGAALFMALCRSLLRAACDLDGGGGGFLAASALQFANEYIATIHERANMFATVFFGVFDPATGELEYANGGHEPPLIVSSSGSVTVLEPTGPAVGMVAESGYRSRTARLEPGDTLVAFTDGIIEARSTSGELFSEERLRLLLAAPVGSPDEILDGIERAVDRHEAGAGRSDDLTLLAVRRLGRHPDETEYREEGRA